MKLYKKCVVDIGQCLPVAVSTLSLFVEGHCACHINFVIKSGNTVNVGKVYVVLFAEIMCVVSEFFLLAFFSVYFI